MLQLVFLRDEWKAKDWARKENGMYAYLPHDVTIYSYLLLNLLLNILFVTDPTIRAFVFLLAM